jgi:hypothetical protein
MDMTLKKDSQSSIPKIKSTENAYANGIPTTQAMVLILSKGM